MSKQKRSYMAFKFTMGSIVMPDMYLWTVTTKEAMDVLVVRKMWNHALHGSSGLQQSFPTLCGLRVFEMHPGGHGLHIHFVVSQRLPVDIVRVITARAGFGRIDVKKIPGTAAMYLGKYLNKSERPECLKGCRLWAAFGRTEGSKVSDIVVEDKFTNAYRFLKSVVRNWSELKFAERVAFVNGFTGGATLEECFESINFKVEQNELWRLQHVEDGRNIRALIENEKMIDYQVQEKRMAGETMEGNDLKKWADEMEERGNNPF